jgi:hypothetical protein
VEKSGTTFNKLPAQKLLGVNSQMMPDLELSLDVNPSVRCTDGSSAGRKSWFQPACQISVKGATGAQNMLATDIVEDPILVYF